jgi:hypothetical protein
VNDNTLGAFMVGIMFTWLLLVCGEPDLLDAIIYALTGGALK